MTAINIGIFIYSKSLLLVNLSIKNPDKNKVEFKEVGNDSKMISLEEALNFIKSKKIN